MSFLDPVTVTPEGDVKRAAESAPVEVADSVTAHIAVFDTTLRDGEQSPGCSMTPAEKLRIARQLERLGVDVIEAGFPVASPGECDSVRAIAEQVRGASIAALCRAREEDIEVGARAIEGAARPRVHVFLATSAIHLKHKLRITQAECLEQAAAAVRLAKSAHADVEFSAEDASRTDYSFLREVLQAVQRGGRHRLQRARHRRLRGARRVRRAGRPGCTGTSPAS